MTTDYKTTVFLPEHAVSDARRAAQARAGVARALGARWTSTSGCARPRRAARSSSSMTARPTPTGISYRHRAQQDPQGLRHPRAADAGQGRELRARLGLPRPADRMEDRGGIPRQGQGQGRGAGRRVPARMPRVRREMDRRAARASSSGSASIGDWEQSLLRRCPMHAEAQIVRELGKFALNGSLYRGSRPVMWSVVEKTALAEAEIEYHDHKSATIYVQVPGRRSRRMPALAGRGHRHLDDDALDHSRQPRDRLRRRDRIRGHSRSPASPRAPSRRRRETRRRRRRCGRVVEQRGEDH